LDARRMPVVHRPTRLHCGFHHRDSIQPTTGANTPETSSLPARPRANVAIGGC